MSANGETVQLPAVHIGFDATVQTVHLQFDPQQFKTWEMVLAVLEMARLKAESMRRMTEVAQMQQQMAEVQQAESIRRNLRR